MSATYTYHIEDKDGTKAVFWGAHSAYIEDDGTLIITGTDGGMRGAYSQGAWLKCWEHPEPEADPEPRAGSHYFWLGRDGE
jgi:hypothetical protein